MPIKIAFMGFRHGHIFDLYSRAGSSDEFRIVAACEEDPQTRQQLKESGNANITHDSYQAMLREVDCDAVAVGDYYGKRADIIMTALNHGKHVVSDKPICITLAELDAIKALAAEKGLVVGCMLDLRDSGLFIRMRELVLGGEIGEVHAVHVGGQHPLLLGSRPGWYFEEGKHGGSINDIGIHAFDGIPWITGLKFDEVVAARSWNAFAKDFPHFHDAGQFMLKMNNGCGVMGDVSYFMPNSMGYKLDLYWRMTIFGRKGIVETSWNSPGIKLAMDGKEEVELIPPAEGTPGGYLVSFANEVKGIREGLSPSSDEVYAASRVSLTVQQAGFENQAHVKL